MGSASFLMLVLHILLQEVQEKDQWVGFPHHSTLIFLLLKDAVLLVLRVSTYSYFKEIKLHAAKAQCMCLLSFLLCTILMCTTSATPDYLNGI